MKISQHSGQPDDAHKRSSATGKRRWQGSTNTTIRSLFSGGPGLKLVLLIIMLLMVIWAMNYAGKPETWNWMFNNASQPTDIDTRKEFNNFRQPGQEIQDVQPGGESNSIDPAIDSSAATNIDENQIQSFRTPEADSIEGLRLDFWKQTLRKLDARDQVNLGALVRSAAKQLPVAKGQTAVLSNLLARIEKLRSAYDAKLLEEANRRLATETAFSQSMIGFQQIWNAAVYPAMQAVVNDQPQAALLDETLQSLPEIVAQAASQLVLDRSNVGRSVESYAWFDAWSEIFQAAIDPLANHAVTVTQLLSQPAAYRGETVSVKGRALRVEKIPAARNPLGIESYYVVWIKPEQASIYPYCVYSLMIPEALNSSDRNQSSWATDLPVESSARFFKVRLFDAGEAAFAPLLMSAALRVDSNSHLAASREPWMPSRNWLLTTMVCVGLLAVSIAWTVFRATTRRRREFASGAEMVESQLKLLEDDQRIETVSEKLNRMADSKDTIQP